MSWTDKDIDNLFKEKAAKTSFEYDNAYWKEMEGLLPKNSGKDIFWIATSILFIGLLGFTFFKTNEITSENSPRLVADNSMTLNAEVEKTIASQQKTNSDATTKSNTSSIIKTNSPSVSKDKSTLNKSPNGNSSSNLFSSENSRVIQTKSTQHSVTKDNTPLVIDNDSGFIKNDIPSKLDFSQNTAAFQSPETNPGTNNIRPKTESMSPSSDGVISTIALRKATLFPSEEVELSPMYSSLNMPLRSQMYVQVLGGISQSMVTPSNQLSYSFGAGFGLQMNKGRFTFNTGINGVWSFHDDLILTRQAKVYGFGSEIINSEIKYKEIFSLEADLSIGYQFSNHIIRVGVRPSYILGAKIGYKETQNNDGDDEQSENYYGYRKGISLWGIKPMIGYTYLLNPNFSIGINVGLQLTPLIDEKYITGQNRSMPIDGQIFIRRTLHLRK